MEYGLDVEEEAGARVRTFGINGGTGRRRGACYFKSVKRDQEWNG